MYTTHCSKKWSTFTGEIKQQIVQENNKNVLYNLKFRCLASYTSPNIINCSTFTKKENIFGG